MQDDLEVRAACAVMQQPIVTHGEHVERLDAASAIDKHRPQVVIASWVMQKYRPERAAFGGNMFGVDEEALIDACETYLVIGNKKVHSIKSIWSRPHTKISPHCLYSGAHNGTPEFIAYGHQLGKCGASARRRKTR